MGTLEYRLKEARQFAGLTQKELSQVLGVSLRTITNHEKDGSKITIQLAQKIAQACKVDEIWLLTGRGKMEYGKSFSDENGSRPPHSDLVSLFEQQELAWDINWELLKLEKIKKDDLKEVLKFIKFRRLDREQSASNSLNNADLNNLREKKRTGGKDLKNGTEDT